MQSIFTFVVTFLDFVLNSLVSALSTAPLGNECCEMLLLLTRSSTESLGKLENKNNRVCILLQAPWLCSTLFSFALLSLNCAL